MDINSEELAYWYLRLNGFLSIQNFIVHPDAGSDQETDVDLMAVRFPFRCENLVRPMKDDVPFARHRKPFIVFAEVKARLCKLNGPWTKPERNNMERVLCALGAFTKRENKWIADEMYANGFFENQYYRVSLMCLGAVRNQDIEKDYPQVPQIIWPDVLAFIFDRFREYKNQKKSHGQWDSTGQRLWAKTEEFRNSKEDFCSHFNVV